MDKITIFIAACFGVYGLAQLSIHVVLPMFNTYLEYRLRLEEIEDNRKWNEEGLQRNIDDPDIKQRSGKSDEGTSLHDEELPI